MEDSRLFLGGRWRSCNKKFGADYVTELQRILRTHVKPVSRAWLEWGMGHTTAAALELVDELGCERFVSIDDNEAYRDEVLPQLKAWPGFASYCCDLTGPRESDRDPGVNYATFPLTLGTRFDFIFIDGRRRLECALVASLLCHADTAVVLHDYRRGRYQPALALYDLVEDGPQFRVMRVRPGLYPDGPPAAAWPAAS